MMSSNFQWYIKKQWGLSEEDTLKLQNFYEKRSLEKGEVLLQIEEFSNEYYFVESGLLKSYSYSSNGKEHILQFAPENWLIGDRGSIHLKERSSFYVEAIEDSLVCIFNESFFDEFSKLCANFRERNEALLHKHVRHLNHRINLLLGASAEERYVDFLKLYPNLSKRVPLRLIASYLGITPESLSRVRKKIAHKEL